MSLNEFVTFSLKQLCSKHKSIFLSFTLTCRCTQIVRRTARDSPPLGASHWWIGFGPGCGSCKRNSGRCTPIAQVSRTSSGERSRHFSERWLIPVNTHMYDIPCRYHLFNVSILYIINKQTYLHLHQQLVDLKEESNMLWVNSGDKVIILHSWMLIG